MHNNIVHYDYYKNSDLLQNKFKEAILNSMSIKPKSHNFDLADAEPAVVRFMSHTGG